MSRLIEGGTELILDKLAEIQELEDISNLTATNIILTAGLKDKDGNNWQPRKISGKMKELGFQPSKAERRKGEVLKIYSYDKNHILMLAKKYLSDVELLDKVKMFCNPVTDVTVVSEREEEGLSDCIKPKKQEVADSVTKVTTVTQLHNTSKVKLLLDRFELADTDSLPITDFSDISRDTLDFICKKPIHKPEHKFYDIRNNRICQNCFQKEICYTKEKREVLI